MGLSVFPISLRLVQQQCPPASCCCVCLALTQKGECHLLSHLSSWVSLEIFNACGETGVNPNCFVNEPNAGFTRQMQDWIASARLPFPSGPLQPEPVSPHPPATFSLQDLFCLTRATRFNLGGVEGTCRCSAAR